MLGVSRHANTEEIKRAFFTLSKRWHPDKHPDANTAAEVVFRGIKDSWECLSDAEQRRRYDRKLFRSEL